MIPQWHHREALELFGIAKRLLVDNGVMRIDIETRLWISRRSLDSHVHIWWRPNGFSELVMSARDNGPIDPPSIATFHPGGWRKILRKFNEINLTVVDTEPAETQNAVAEA